MNIIQEKKAQRYARIKMLIDKRGEPLIAAYPDLGVVANEFIVLFKSMARPMIDASKKQQPYTADKKEIKGECLEGIWKLIAAMKYRFELIGDEVGAKSVKFTISGLKKMSEEKFYQTCQMVMNQYDPIVYTPHGVIEAEMVVLKQKLVVYPTRMQGAKDAKNKRKGATAKINEIQKKIDKLLSSRFDALMEVAKDAFKEDYLIYKNIKAHGFQGRTTGKPFKKGTLAPGEIVVIIKQDYRSKLALIIKNNGKAMLSAGRSTNQSNIQGTPFSIEPGNTRQRVSLKLGSKGEYILIQNVGDVEGSYWIWMKE